jgi:DNA-binding CsgD family transcriptional regulator
MQVAALVWEGQTNREIAKTIGTTEPVVKNYLRNTFNKLGVGSRLELAIYVARHGGERWWAESGMQAVDILSGTIASRRLAERVPLISRFSKCSSQPALVDSAGSIGPNRDAAGTLFPVNRVELLRVRPWNGRAPLLAKAQEMRHSRPPSPSRCEIRAPGRAVQRLRSRLRPDPESATGKRLQNLAFWP